MSKLKQEQTRALEEAQRAVQQEFGLFRPMVLKRLYAIPHIRLAQYVTARALVSVNYRGKVCYPGFQFDATGTPLPVMAEVLKAFEGEPSWTVVIWLVSHHRALLDDDGMALRPVDCLTDARRLDSLIRAEMGGARADEKAVEIAALEAASTPPILELPQGTAFWSVTDPTNRPKSPIDAIEDDQVRMIRGAFDDRVAIADAVFGSLPEGHGIRSVRFGRHIKDRRLDRLVLDCPVRLARLYGTDAREYLTSNLPTVSSDLARGVDDDLLAIAAALHQHDPKLHGLTWKSPLEPDGAGAIVLFEDRVDASSIRRTTVGWLSDALEPCSRVMELAERHDVVIT